MQAEMCIASCMPTCVVLKLPDSSEEGVDGVGVGGVGRERVADLVAEGGAVFLEREEGLKKKRDRAGSERVRLLKEISKAPLQLQMRA